jgi:hypothetical protein
LKPPLNQPYLGKRGVEAMADETGNTGTQDVTYNLVSILYHALQGAETYDQYIADAERGGDQELTEFFREAKEENSRRAERAKQLLAQRLGRGQSQTAAG